MSGRIVGEVFANAPRDLTPAERLILLSLAESARDTDRTARHHCSTADIAHRTGLAEGTVRNTLATLINKRGLIRPVHANVHKGGRHQEYVLAKLHEQHRFATHYERDTP